MKTLRILMLALLLPVFVMTGCTTGGDNPGDAQIELPNNSEKTQTAFADDETTGGFTFTAKQAWTATVTESGSTRASNVPWLRLLFDGEETYSGAAGKFTLVIELDENYSGKTRTATITIKSGNDTISITVTQDGKTEDGTVPVEPGKPVPDGMRYVSRIDMGYDYTYAHVFEYDSRNRVSRVINPNGNISVLYNDANRTITINYEREDGEEDLTQAPVVFELNASGAVVAGKSSDGNGTFTYADGYLSKFIHNGEEWGEEVFTMTWSGGNKSRMVHEYKSADEYGNYNQYPTDLTYNASWPNNPLCNLDLNALLAPFDDGIYGEWSYPEFLGLFGKRSKNMVSGIVRGTDYGSLESKFTVEYDADGFVSKITETRYSDGGEDKTFYTITYR